jgi:transposase
MAETRRKFDQDFREGAVRLVRETGRPIAQVANDLGINEGTLGNWVNAGWRRRGDGTGLGEDERAELARLRRENAELAMETSQARKLSSGGLRRGVAGWREGDVLVVVLPGLESVVEAAQEPSGQVALGGGVPVAGGFAPVVVGPGARRGGEGRERPDVAGGG